MTHPSTAVPSSAASAACATAATTGLSAVERAELLAEAAAELADLRSQVEALNAKIGPLYDLVGELENLDDVDLVSERSPADLFTDAALREQVVQRNHARGRGSKVCHDYLTAAFRQLAPEGFCGYEQRVSDDYLRVTRTMPHLALRYHQDITEVADALTRIHPALAVDGTLIVPIHEHTCGATGSWQIVMDTPETARVVSYYGHVERQGSLREALAHVADRLWSHGGPDDDVE